MPSSSTRNYLNVLKPPLDVPDVAIFSYPKLKSIVEENFSDKFETIDEIFERYDADDEEALDLRLSHEYLIMVALKLQQADTDKEKKLWSKRYTDVSIETFGAPNLEEVSFLAKKEVGNLRNLPTHSLIPQEDKEFILAAYESLITTDSSGTAVKKYDSLLKQTAGYLENTYDDVLSLFDHEADTVLTRNEIEKRYREALHILGWSDWTVGENQTAQMSVSPAKKIVYIGAHLPTLSARRARALFAHEVLTHAQRARRGESIDRSLSLGLPGYVASEEGLGVLLEASLDGKLPHRVTDRYIDIALALGMGASRPMSRFELFRLTMTRMLLRLGGDAEIADTSLLWRLAWQHVNRIYKGSLGNEFVGVFTRDVSYYTGFVRMAEYLTRYRDGDFEGALDFVLSGKFDPTNDSHRLYVHKRKFKVNARTEDITP